MEDSKIVDLYWDRNEEAIVCTQQKYGAYLLKIARNILSDKQDSEECVNDTYLAAWKNRPKNLSSYLGRIVRQISIDVFRKKNSLKRGGSEYILSYSELEEDVSGGTDPLKEIETGELAGSVSAYLRTLTERELEMFIRRYYYFDSIKEIAAGCGISQSNAKTRLFRLRKDLKEYLRKEDLGL